MATKASTPKTTGTKSAGKPYQPKLAVTSDEVEATATGPASGTEFIRRKEFVERVVAASGLKPNAVKTTLDAVLQELGAALSRGEAVNLPPLGKLSVNRRKEIKNGEVLICKLRRAPTVVKLSDTGLAETGDEG